MPRVARPAGAPASTLQGQSAQIPLNDDRQEKATRVQSRQARHGLHMDQIRAAASPVRRLASFDRAASSSPRTPTRTQRRVASGNKDEDGLLAVVPGSSMTPMKRVPMLANFEEWMKMATDNKINATNSWNFALIDYFHDMSLLKEGDGVNFQKASCTLDGCVKIYTSRVDSVATETGKLLSGLADSGSRKEKQLEGGEGDEASDAEDGEDGQKKTRKKKRSSEATLAPSFAPLQLKKFELDFSVDPLFKKASADFDEGGAKGLLLNHLAIDVEGRIVFDSSNDADAEAENSENVDPNDETEAASQSNESSADGKPRDIQIDINSLAARFFPNLDILAGQDICPSLKNFDLSNPAAALDIPSLRDLEGMRDEDAGITDAGDDMGNDAGLVDLDFDLGPETGFGDGGEAWAQAAVLAPLQSQQLVDFDGNLEDIEGDGAAANFEDSDDMYRISMVHNRGESNHETILSYFDQSLRKNWAGPQHWKIRRINEAAKASTQAAPAKRKEKEPFEIDFLAPLSVEAYNAINTYAATNSAITLPKAQWKSKSRNLLPDDKHFNSRQLVRLFLKPKAHIGNAARTRNNVERVVPTGPAPLDEAYWAQQSGAPMEISTPEDAPQAGQYDADFFQDDGLAFPGGLPDDDDVEDDFADARERFSPDDGLQQPPQGTIDNTLDLASNAGTEGITQNMTYAFGTQLVTSTSRLRPEYVQYARTAKKVDVRRLKEEMWKGIEFETETVPKIKAHLPNAAESSGDTSIEANGDSGEPTLRFTDVLNGLQKVYNKATLKDISTSYGFICLLHLANEKGLQLGNEEGLEELSIRRDLAGAAAQMAEVGA